MSLGAQASCLPVYSATILEADKMSALPAVQLSRLLTGAITFLQIMRHSLKPLLIAASLIGLSFSMSYSIEPQIQLNDQYLLELGGAVKEAPAATLPNLKFVSYNIRWRSGDELRQLARLFETDPEIGGASVLALQEVDRNKKRSGNKNSAKLLAAALGMHYAWAAPPAVNSKAEEETGVAILSRYPLTEVRRLLLPHKGPGGRRRVALGATIKIGATRVRVYSVHGETRIPVDCKIAQLQTVLDDLAGHPANMPAAILGDFNTWEPAAVTGTFKLFADAGFHTPFEREPTFMRRVLFIPIELKLDWIWLRRLSVTRHGIDQKILISDHWPLWIDLSDKL
jgi:endonuclease/exonuclease/phosphatase family metal-dependent hydrolase